MDIQVVLGGLRRVGVVGHLKQRRLEDLGLVPAQELQGRVDRDADAVEHILGEKLVALLEAKLVKLHTTRGLAVPASPHPITPGD